jgi:hypothetical protein
MQYMQQTQFRFNKLLEFNLTNLSSPCSLGSAAEIAADDANQINPSRCVSVLASRLPNYPTFTPTLSRLHRLLRLSPAPPSYLQI